MYMQQTKTLPHTVSPSRKTLSPFTFSSYTMAHQGHPERNEDTMIIDRRRGLAAVFDGVGGANAGEVASQLGARTIRRAWRRIAQRHLSTGHSDLLLLSEDLDVQEMLQQVTTEAQNAISDEGDRRVTLAPIQEGKDPYPGTTAVVTVFCQYPTRKGYVMGYAHVGDSRVYLLRGDQPLQRLTFDDGYFLLKIQDQTINEEDALRIDQAIDADQLSDMERDIFNKRNGITQSLSHFTERHSSLVIHTSSIEIFPGDRILLCSDGIHDNLTDTEIEAIIRHRARTTTARHLVQSALSRSQEICLRAKQDDMSAIVITCNF